MTLWVCIDSNSIRTSGSDARSRTITSGRAPSASAGIAATEMAALRPRRISAAARSIVDKPMKARSTSADNSRASWVGTIFPPILRNSEKPRVSSRSRISRLTAGCETCSMSAAAEMEPEIMVAWKASRPRWLSI